VRFGLWYDFRNPSSSGRSLPGVYAATLEQIQLAEEWNYDDIWLSEHHFVDDGYLPSLLPMAAAISVLTTRVRIGTNILLMPFHNPIRLAEDCAVVDNLSNGRFVFGPAVGYRTEEFATFNINRRARGGITDEAIKIMRLCWTQESFSFEGDHFSFQDVRCTPKPVQRPTIPIWIGAVQGEALQRAARLGDGLLSGDSQQRDKYLAALDLYGKPEEAAGPRIASSGESIFCSDDPERDWARLAPHALYQTQRYAAWFRDAGQPIFGDPPVDVADLVSRGLYFVGTPQQVADRIRSAYERAPFDRYVYWAIWPGVPVDAASRSVQLFAEKVIPLLRDLPEPGGGAWTAESIER
jgi:alkanesulfonate monooxygenase SsuD/methylene tetrahydromethanopterin reductase-like flavin-dependent oxidoreductase (luciferase family)